MVRSWFLYQKIGGSIPPAEPLSPFVKPSPSLGVEEAPPRDSSPTTLDKKNPRRVGWGPGVVVAPSLCVAVAPVRFRGSPTDERVAGCIARNLPWLAASKVGRTKGRDGALKKDLSPRSRDSGRERREPLLPYLLVKKSEQA
ncbi:hypothetical protein [Phaffia rhodozyma]|uniref:Uncharacterized protein n=1 Tax=Phaffia rhodozyma TaxID=264483 RepID=A0A0F7SKK7_PHARH|nr:hypothetical protein [Phaffia rhodozyma]